MIHGSSWLRFQSVYQTREAAGQSTPRAGIRVISSSAALASRVAMKRAASATWAGVIMSARSGAPGMASQSGVSTAPADEHAHAHARAPQLLGEHPAQPEQAVLGGGVGGAARAGSAR